MKNRQRRAAKQRRRAQGRASSGDRIRQSTSGDPRVMVAATVYAAAEAVADGELDDALELIGMLEVGPPIPGGSALVERVLTDALDQQRALAAAHGWTDDDLAEVQRRRWKVPPAASEIERNVRLLAVLRGLGRLPTVAPVRAATGAGADAGMLAKIRALLAKAESTTFPEEAEALTTKAQELMTRHRIERVVLDGADERGDQPVGRRIWLDDPYADAKARLLAAVADANRCRAVQLGGLGCSHVVGFPVDLQVVELLHTSLLVQATTALAAAGPQTDARGRSRTRSFRQSFLMAYAWRIGDRLHEANETTEVAADAERGGGLLPVLARRDDEVQTAVAEAFPFLRSKSVSISNAAGWAAGTTAAEQADLAVGARLAPG